MNKATWKWNARNEAYLTAKGESSISPRARVYACDARPRGSRYVWTVAVGGQAFAVCIDTATALKLGRAQAEVAASEAWVLFTKRTEDPKLSWLEAQLDDAGIAHTRDGRSFHAPILKVKRKDLDAAWAILDPVDDVEDDDQRFLNL